EGREVAGTATDGGGGAPIGAAEAAGAAVAGAAAPVAGMDGSLIVAVGLGGNAMRTVSFLGCTLAASPGLGGTPPVGGLGLFSAIISDFSGQAKVGVNRCQTLNRNAPGREKTGRNKPRCR